jgi:(1->4)-alpha-D-glucan 1-alpha-D-glucosylmutase
VIERAIAAAKRRNRRSNRFSIFCDILLSVSSLAEPRAQISAVHRADHGKGLEDTAFYIYNRLAALNEVGGEPQQFGLSVDAFHERNLDRHRNWPATLLATSTHDTKRSEDVRARMVAISEIPELWRRSSQRWRTGNRRWKKDVNDSEAPTPTGIFALQSCSAPGRSRQTGRRRKMSASNGSGLRRRR